MEEFDPVLYKALRNGPQVIGHCLILLELLIYLWIIYHLWKHDKENYQAKIITETMKRERQQKNVITLKGQVLSYVIETSFGIYISVHMANFAFADASVMPIYLIIMSTAISIVELTTSNEMRRFLRNRFNLNFF